MTGDAQAVNTTNRQVEDAAITFVLAWEASQGRPAVDTRHRGACADVAGDTRTIEVKAYGRTARGQELWLEVRQIDEARRNPDFWLYIVENVRQGDPARFRLLQIGGQDLQALVSRAVERRYFTVPFPTSVYDQLTRAHGITPPS